MVQRVATVAFEGVEARTVDVQVQVAAGMPAFQIVGLADKAVRVLKFRTDSDSGAHRRSRAPRPPARLCVGLLGLAVRLSHPSPASRRSAARPTGTPANSAIASRTHCQRYSAEALSAKRWYASAIGSV